jgi:serine/threonine protein kinase
VKGQNELKSARVDSKDIFIADSTTTPPDGQPPVISRITLDDVVYTVTAHAGTGTYGALCYVQDPSGNEYVLKEQYTSAALIKSILETELEGAIGLISQEGTYIRDQPYLNKLAAIDYVIRYLNIDYEPTTYTDQQNRDAAVRKLKKIQTKIAYKLDLDKDFIKEALIHHILYTVGAPVPRLYKMFYGMRTIDGSPKDMMYLLMDRLHIDCHKKLRESKREVRETVIKGMYRQFSPELERLFTTYAYNHGDFKPNNCMFDSSGKLYFIDFGFSRLTVKDGSGEAITITTSPFNTKSNKSKDNTLMAVSARTHSLGGATSDFIHKIITGHGCNLAAYDSSGGIQCTIQDGRQVRVTGLANMYYFIDRYENPTGTFEAIAEALTPPATGGAKMTRRNTTRGTCRKNVSRKKSKGHVYFPRP